eukprot:c5208_g1_i2.p2 GENE.c5208_g1_i2~~c5208_g1_i2.p2  ORF type:complete len:142 (-),score=32.77 c5208_g1_i2:163-588(-)
MYITNQSWLMQPKQQVVPLMTRNVNANQAELARAGGAAVATSLNWFNFHQDVPATLQLFHSLTNSPSQQLTNTIECQDTLAATSTPEAENTCKPTTTQPHTDMNCVDLVLAADVIWVLARTLFVLFCALLLWFSFHEKTDG